MPWYLFSNFKQVVFKLVLGSIGGVFNYFIEFFNTSFESTYLL